MDVRSHYDYLIDINNDPVFDSEELKDYMNKWDGDVFLNEINPIGKCVLEIGVGTGRMAVKLIDKCKCFTGIDISPKTVKRAKENLKTESIICDDFLTHEFDKKFDVIYSTLTMMHFKDKELFIKKVSKLLNDKGRFILSIDKNKNEYIDMGDYKLKIYPDRKEDVEDYMEKTQLHIEKIIETEFAYIFVCAK